MEFQIHQTYDEEKLIDLSYDVTYPDHIAISSDGIQIVTFSTETYKLKLYKTDNLSKLYTINFNNVDALSVKANWSLAVSNEFTLADKSNDVLIAVSCYDDQDMKFKSHSNEQEVDDDMYDEGEINHVEPFTWIVSVARQSKINSPIDDIGGIVKFLDKDDEDYSTTDMVLINAHGITKSFIKRGVEYDNGFFNFFNSFDKSIENFYLPKGLAKDEICGFSSLIKRSLVKGRFVVESYKNKEQIVEMYNLKTNLLETFQKPEESSVLVEGKGFPYFAISHNESLFAYCRGANSITIYLMENGLEVITKKFSERSVQILFFDFIQDDSKLLIAIKEEKYDEDTAKMVVMSFIVVWDLFSSSDNCVRKIDTFSLFPTDHQRIVNSSGNLLTITEKGKIISILKEPEMIKLLNPKSDNIRNIIPLNNISEKITASATGHHLVYNSSGKYLDSKTEIIVEDPEPWVRNRNYERTSVYLDDDKSIQLIIGESTVQVWRRRSSTRRVLEYIWTNHYTKEEHYRQIQIKSLEVGRKEFFLILNIPSGITPHLGHEIIFEWPEKVNNLVDACQALEFLDKKKYEPSNPKKQYEFEDLIQQIECIIKKSAIKKSGLWRMLEIRFDIMANLIRGNYVSIIKNILSSESDGKNKHLHIPRCYSWKRDKKDTDLKIAIKRTEGGYRKDTIIVKYLLDYYSDNAVKNSNWMLTVSKAIPLLYEHHLEFYVKELFQQPCFGTNVVYLDKSYIRKKDINKGNYKNVHALNVNLGLVQKIEHKSLGKLIHRGKQFSGKIVISKIWSKKTTTNPSLISQVYMVPLPDFIVHPEKFDDKQKGFWKILLHLIKLLFWPRGHVLQDKVYLSPFMRMIRKEDGAEIYDNPSIAAVIDFKWSAVRNYFLRHAFMYFIFGLIFTISAGAIDKKINENLLKFEYGNTFVKVLSNISFFWIGFYLLNAERVEFKYQRRRYLDSYNFFDLFSVILPLIVKLYPVLFINNEGNFQNQFKTYIIISSFTVLIMWMKLFLLLRYFERPGAYIYIIINILKQIMFFFVFIILFVFALGHAMYILLRDPVKMGLKPDGSSYKLYDSGGELPYEINQSFDPTQMSDNYFVSFTKSVKEVFFWTSGRWDQLDQWSGFWPVDVFSIIGSVLLVTILQNMLIAIMTGAYEDAKEAGRHAVLKFRAELIEDYETVEKPFGSKKGNPRYIYFIGNPNYIEGWLKKSEKAKESYENFLAKFDVSNPWYYNDDDNEGYRSFREISYDSVALSRKEQETPLSLYWFVDETDDSNIKKSNVQDETKMLKGKIQTMDENINYLISLFKNQQR